MVGKIETYGIGLGSYIIRHATITTGRQETGPIIAEISSVLLAQRHKVFDILSGKRTETVFRNFCFENREICQLKSSRGHIGRGFDVKRGRYFMHYTVAAHEVGHLSPSSARVGESIIVDVEFPIDILELDIGGFGKGGKHISGTGRRSGIGNNDTTGSM